MRERPTDDAVNAVFLRITPARAGKTSSTILSGHIQQDHPRSCGKDMGFPSDPRTLPGSPPLVRERRSVATVCRQSWGITPARAGKTKLQRRPIHPIEDHPRSCGKDPYLRVHQTFLPGSPPLVRERLAYNEVSSVGSRITPARAGKTGIVVETTDGHRDHPRSCGKDLAQGDPVRLFLGSPPLVRERLRSTGIRRLTKRITPARAGKTVMDPFICAISLLPVFKIYLISFQSISTLQLLRNLGGC